ncbi:MAG: YcaO-like family protein, partial [Desulfovibrio sp.]|nr:YcaO-like family protein [Desulfovibrio sp.]
MTRDIPLFSSQLPELEYAYTHEETQATTGDFSCVPPADLGFDAALERLEAAPMDDFLHQHLLRLLSAEKTEELLRLAATCHDAAQDDFKRPVLAALLLECAILLPQHAAVCAAFPADAALRLAYSSPALYLRAASQPDAETSAAWSEIFRGSICDHHALPRPDEVGVPLLFSPEEIEAAASDMDAHAGSMAGQHARLSANTTPAWQRPPAQETFLRALDALMESGTVAGPEMRHEASLSPIALLRPWQVDIAVRSGALNHRLHGQATAYGRGMSLAAARASYAMEIVERASTYVSVGPAEGGSKDKDSGKAEALQVLDRKHAMPLTRARFSQLRQQGKMVLDPNVLPIEAPYLDAPLHWVGAVNTDGNEVLVPAQAVFLFCNLDEPALFLAGGSTGLASGNTLDEARQAALTEIFERDAEATTPFSRSRCFILKSRDERMQSLLDDYAACGINVQFQDITTEFGLPVYQ